MKKRTLFRQFFGVHIVILFLAVGFVALYTWYEGRRTFKDQWISELEVQADLAVAMFEGSDTRLQNKERCEKIFRRLAGLDSQRFTLILPDGSVIGDSRAMASRMDSHELRPEVKSAREGGHGYQERYSSTLKRQMLYVARRIPADMTLPEQAVLRVSVPVTTLLRKFSASNREVIVLVSIVLLATFVMSYFAALRIVGPVSDLQTGLNRIGRGEYSFRLKIPFVPHLADLARSINQSADQLEKHISELREERNLRALIFKSMDIGIIAVDTRHRIMNMNQSAVNLLNVSAEKVEGSTIGELVRSPELLSFLDRSEHSEQKVEGCMRVEINSESGEERTLTLHSAVMRDLRNIRIGTLIVVNDVTLLRKLETVRQDFVDNVSHELRTPVTSIKGFAETLLDGALEDPKTARHFVGIIARQADQLEQIIRDLLELSRLDQSADKELDCRVTPAEGLLTRAVELCQNRMQECGAQIKVDCPADICVDVHAGLIEQALVNLIDNALKYGCTDEQKRVEVSAVKEGLAVKIRVRDFGCGIEKPHLERMFERFYRIDRGRSRELGGTGLGLAIVKHIVMIHKGTVTVESQPGQGSSFIITLSAHSAV